MTQTGSVMRPALRQCASAGAGLRRRAFSTGASIRVKDLHRRRQDTPGTQTTRLDGPFELDYGGTLPHVDVAWEQVRAAPSPSLLVRWLTSLAAAVGRPVAARRAHCLHPALVLQLQPRRPQPRRPLARLVGRDGGAGAVRAATAAPRRVLSLTGELLLDSAGTSTRTDSACSARATWVARSAQPRR